MCMDWWPYNSIKFEFELIYDHQIFSVAFLGSLRYPVCAYLFDWPVKGAAKA
jgi:hypothetical protein